MIKFLSALSFLVASSSVFGETSTFKIDRQELVPPIELYNEWLAFSPDKWPTDEDYLKRMDGAILLEKAQAEYVVENFTALDLFDLVADMTATKDTQKIPYKLSLEWKTRDGHQGTFHAEGYLELVEGIFNLDLNNPKEFRDRFVQHVHIDSVTGDLVTLANGDPQSSAESIKVIKEVIAPFVVGKLVSFARIGFNSIEQKLKDKLQDELEKIPKRRAL